MIHKDQDCAWADIDKQFSSYFHMSPVLVKIECHFSLYISCPFAVIHPLRQLAMLHFASLPFLFTSFAKKVAVLCQEPVLNFNKYTPFHYPTLKVEITILITKIGRLHPIFSRQKTV